MTNIVRPRIAPLRSSRSFAYVSVGSAQLFVGPASCFVGVQTKVNCSTRATSFGFDRCRYECGTFFWFSSINTFCLSDSAIRNSFSRSEPSHQKIFSGCVTVAIWCTQSSTALLPGFASPIPLAGSILLWLQFDSAAIWSSGQVWRLFTYGFIHAPSGLLWFAIEMYLLFVFGREVERFLGRRAYIALYAFLLVTPPALLTIWGLWERCAIAGAPALHFGMFIAFARIYPRVEL